MLLGEDLETLFVGIGMAQESGSSGRCGDQQGDSLGMYLNVNRQLTARIAVELKCDGVIGFQPDRSDVGSRAVFPALVTAHQNAREIPECGR